MDSLELACGFATANIWQHRIEPYTLGQALNFSLSKRGYPRTLAICSASLNYKSADGIIFSNLFRGWPTQALAQIHADEDAPDPEICPSHWRISVESVPLDRAFRRMLGRRRVAGLGPALHPAWSNDLEAFVAGSDSHARRRTLVSAWADCVPYHLDAPFWNWLTDFAPEIIFTNLGSIRQIGLVQSVAGRLQIPVLPFFCDDWPRTHFRGDKLKVFPRWLLLHKLSQVMRDAGGGCAASVAMAEEYRERYGMPFENFMYCVDAPSSPPPGPDGNPIRFCYVGGLHLDRWRSLMELGACLGELNDSGTRAELHVYAPARDLDRYGPQMSRTASMRLMGTLRPQDVPATLIQNHVLVHVESFHPFLSEYTRLSFSTKIPQYLAAGRPVLAYGPEELASCRYIEETGSGLVVGRRERGSITDALKRLCSEGRLRKEMGERAWRTARLNHGSESMRERFRAVLAGVAWSHS
jgi:hypothetical protein